jgi:hypothetical protein
VLTIERVGPDLVCRLHGGAEHVGAVALGWWDGTTVRVSQLAAGSHKEGPLAVSVAEQLCRASRANVTCVAGIHYDGLSSAQIEAICEEAYALSARGVEVTLGLVVGSGSERQREEVER